MAAAAPIAIEDRLDVLPKRHCGGRGKQYRRAHRVRPEIAATSHHTEDPDNGNEAEYQFVQTPHQLNFHTVGADRDTIVAMRLCVARPSTQEAQGSNCVF